MQNALNRQRVPGAPRLIETGKLDYDTLSYPAHGMRHDIGNLERRLRYERNYALAKSLGLEGKYSADELLSLELEAQLNAKAASMKLSALSTRFERRRKALERAAAAARDFNNAALAAKDPARISKVLLMSLSAKQKEAARWITIAAIEEELQRLDADEGFLTPELAALIDRAPAPQPERDAYHRRGKTLDAALTALKSKDESAIKALEADDWLSRIDSIERALAENGKLRRNLSRNIQLYRATAYRFASSGAAKAGWRELIDRYAVKLFPRSSYAQKISRARQAQALLGEGFRKIADGELDAAYALLATP
jgi:hypothetical protein